MIHGRAELDPAQQGRYLILATTISRTSGGGRTYLEGLVRGLADGLREGERLGVVAPRDSAEVVAPLVGSRGEVIPVRPAGGATRIFRDAFFLKELANRWGADAAIYPHEWAPRLGVPLVLVVQNVGWLHPESAPAFGWRGWLLRRLVRSTAHRADGVIAVSSLAADLWEQWAGMVGATTLVPEGLTPSEVLDRPSLPPDQTVVVLVGDAGYKGSAFAKEVIASYRRAGGRRPIVVVGDNDRLWPSGTNVLGAVSRDEFLSTVQRSSLLLIPSSVESFGLPALEAAALGTPVLVRAGTPMEEWLGGLGAHALPADHNLWASSLDTVASLRLRSETVREVRCRFAWSAIASIYLEKLRSLKAAVDSSRD